jgi:hypothetical protein
MSPSITRIRNTAIAGALVLLSTAAAHAQDPARTWAGLDHSELTTIHVTDESGAETTGRLLRFEPDALVLLVDGAERRMEAARVKRIQKRGDSLKNGALVGAIIGGALGLLTAGIADCPGSSTNCAGFRITAPLVSGAFYAAVGTGIDALVTGRTTLYVAPGTTSSSALVPLVPAQRGMRAGIRMTVSW